MFDRRWREMADDKLKENKSERSTRSMTIKCNTDNTCGNCRCLYYDERIPEWKQWVCLAAGVKLSWEHPDHGDRKFKCPECNAPTNQGFAGVQEFFISGVPILVNEGFDCSDCPACFNRIEEEPGWSSDCGIYGSPIHDYKQLEPCRLERTGHPRENTSPALWAALRQFRKELAEGKQIKSGTVIIFRDESGTLEVMDDGEILGWTPYVGMSLLVEWGKKPGDWQKKLQPVTEPVTPEYPKGIEGEVEPGGSIFVPDEDGFYNLGMGGHTPKKVL